jgi:hypothetical protein
MKIQHFFSKLERILTPMIKRVKWIEIDVIIHFYKAFKSLGEQAGYTECENHIPPRSNKILFVVWEKLDKGTFFPTLLLL